MKCIITSRSHKIQYHINSELKTEGIVSHYLVPGPHRSAKIPYLFALSWTFFKKYDKLSKFKR